MNKFHLRKEIAELIDSIKEHSESIGNSKHIPQLELELILSKIKKLYEKSIVLNYINQHHLDEWEEHHNPIIPTAIEEVAETIKTKTVEEKTKVPEELLINIQEKKHVEQKDDANVEDKSIEISVQEKVTLDVNSKIAQSGRETLNEKLSKQVADESLLNKLRKKPVEDLLKSIGINERYLFTKELFKGNTEAFMQHVKTINSLNSYKEAQQYLEKEVIPYFNWDVNNLAVSNFLDLVQRRFIK